MRLIFLVTALLLVGCNTTLNSFELNKLIDKCKDRGGIFQIHASTVGDHSANCQDGAWVGVKK